MDKFYDKYVELDRLINAKDLIKSIELNAEHIDDAIDQIYYATTINPIIRAYWIYGAKGKYICSNCGNKKNSKTKYCESCGAYMEINTLSYNDERLLYPKVNGQKSIFGYAYNIYDIENYRMIQDIVSGNLEIRDLYKNKSLFKCCDDTIRQYAYMAAVLKGKGLNGR